MLVQEDKLQSLPKDLIIFLVKNSYNYPHTQASRINDLFWCPYMCVCVFMRACVCAKIL